MYIGSLRGYFDETDRGEILWNDSVIPCKSFSGSFGRAEGFCDTMERPKGIRWGGL